MTRCVICHGVQNYERLISGAAMYAAWRSTCAEGSATPQAIVLSAR